MASQLSRIESRSLALFRGVPRAALAVLFAAALHGPAHAQCALSEASKLTASDAFAGDRFGIDSSVDGDVAIFGASFHADGGAFSGAAYVYRSSGSSWVEEAKLTASDASSGDFFGSAVAIHDNRAVVGAFGDDDGGSQSGAAYVFFFDGTNWVEEAKLVASDADVGDNFGVSVAIDDFVIVVGAHANQDFGLLTGSAYVFRFDGTSWSQDAKLLSSDISGGDFFGRHVSVAGNVALITSIGEDEFGLDTGAAYAFRYDGTWAEEAQLTASDPDPFAQFGSSVSLFENRAVVGAWRGEGLAVDAGSAYVFQFDGANWVEEAKLAASDGATNDFFGNAVATDGTVVVVGAYGDDDDGTNSGSAYVYRYNGLSWTEEAKLSATDAAANDEFGSVVGASAGTAVISASRDDDAGTSSGSAYAFTVDGWLDLGNALAGTNGLPLLVGSGYALGGCTVMLSLSNALPSTFAVLFIGGTRVDAPFLGGVLVPSPDSYIYPIPINAMGKKSLSATWMPGAPSGSSVFLQFWINDPVAVQGFSASNSVSLTVP